MAEMRWRPEDATCVECGHSWDAPPNEAIDSVRRSPDEYVAAIAFVDAASPVQPGWWTPGQYLWHMVDVLRNGTERLLTIALDAELGIPCWDENELAAVRRYDRLSVPVGLRMYEIAVGEWCPVAESVPADAETEHPEFGTLTAADVIRRHAHECLHHRLDVLRAAS